MRLAAALLIGGVSAPRGCATHRRAKRNPRTGTLCGVDVLVVDHPLAQSRLTAMRDIRTDSAKYILYFLNGALLIGCILFGRFLLSSKLGKLLLAMPGMADPRFERCRTPILLSESLFDGHRRGHGCGKGSHTESAKGSKKGCDSESKAEDVAGSKDGSKKGCHERRGHGHGGREPSARPRTRPR